MQCITNDEENMWIRLAFWNLLFQQWISFNLRGMIIASFTIFLRKPIVSSLTCLIIQQFDGLVVGQFYHASFSSEGKLIHFSQRIDQKHFYQTLTGYGNWHFCRPDRPYESTESEVARWNKLDFSSTVFVYLKIFRAKLMPFKGQVKVQNLVNFHAVKNVMRKVKQNSPFFNCKRTQ